MILVGSSGEFSTPGSVPAALDRDPISTLGFKVGKLALTHLFLEMPKIFFSARLEEFF